MLVQMKGGGRENLPQYLARKLIAHGLAEKVTGDQTPRRSSRPARSPERKRSKTTKVAKTAAAAESIDKTTSIPAKIEAGTAGVQNA